MIPDVLQEGLQRYEIGSKIKVLRLEKKLTLAELARHTGLSPPLLSKIERGQLIPPLPTLLRIALVFNVGLEHFFSNPSGPDVQFLRASDRIKLPEGPQVELPMYFFESLTCVSMGKGVEVYHAEFPKRGRASDAHRHAGGETIFMLEGQLLLAVRERELRLHPGDSVCFDAGVAHSYRQLGQETARALIVVSPP